MKHFNQVTKKMSVFLAFLLIGVTTALAQTSVKGTVTDEAGEPIIGASILEKGTTNGTITDFDGNFELRTKSGATLVVSYVGYITQEVRAASSLNVVLKEDTEVLDELIVVGYGVQRKSSVTGAISSVKSEDMQNRTITTAQQALQGKTAGVQLLSNSGAPGQSGAIRVRGFSSNDTSDPLYVVDGLRTSDISNLDPNDIESMEVLKDAASAAIYGAEAGNGVILITTRKASKGVRRISYDFQYTSQKMDHIPDALNASQYIDWMCSGNSPFINQSTLDTYYVQGTDTKWKDVAFETGVMQKHNVGFQGANDLGSIYASMTYTKNDGPVVGDKDTFDRLTGTLNADYKIKDWLKITTNNSISRHHQSTVSEGSNIGGSLMFSALKMDPLTPVVFTDQYLANPGIASFINSYLNSGHTLLTDENGQYYGFSLFTNTNSVNPHVMLNRRYNQVDGFNFSGSTSLELTPIKHFVFTSRLGYRYMYNNSYTYTSPNVTNTDTFQDFMSVTNTTTTLGYWQWENFLNYNQTFADKHNVSAMIGMSYSDTSNYYNSGVVSGSGSGNSAELGFLKNDPNYAFPAYKSGSAVQTVTGGEKLHILKYSYYGRLGYDFANRYYAQFSLRADAADTSILPVNQRWGYFPSVSVGWNITNENWMKNQNIFNQLKLRASWGQNGSTAGLSNYRYAAVIAKGYVYNFDNSGTYYTGNKPSSTGNYNLKWETSEQIDLGVDMRFLNDRLAFGIDWYKKKTKDLIITNTSPSLTIGNTVSPVNAGNVENTGFEFELSWKDRIGDFSYGISGNIATLKNKVTFIDESLTRVAGTTHESMGFYFEKDHPLWYMRGYRFDHIDAQTGNPIFLTAAGEETLTPGTADQTEIGSAIPNFTYGVTLTAAYKGFDLVVFGTGSHGNDAFMGFQRNVRATDNVPVYWYDHRWTGAGDSDALYPAREQTVNWSAYYSSSAMVEDASYFKIKQVQLGYTFPKTLIGKIGLEHVRAYVSLDDFFTFTKYPGYDPEIQLTGNALGLDYGSYPTTKKVVLGVSLSF